MINYKFDADLDTVLQEASNEELGPLVQFIKTDDGQELTEQEAFVRYYPNHQRYVHLISHEIRSLGGHSVANILRGGSGPDYRTVVVDVAKRLKLTISDEEAKDAPIANLEHKILAHVLKDIYGKMDEEQRALFLREVEQFQDNTDEDATATSTTTNDSDTTDATTSSSSSNNSNNNDTNAADQASTNSSEATKGSVTNTEKQKTFPKTYAVVLAVEQEDLRGLSPKVITLLSAVAASSMAHIMGITTKASALGDSVAHSVNQIISLIGSSLNRFASVLSALSDIGGPSYRVTMPCVVHVAMLRIKQGNDALKYRQPYPNQPQLSTKTQPNSPQP